MSAYRILILGASYGSLLGAKLAMAGHHVHLVCLPPEIEAINRDGVIVRLPIKHHNPIEIRSKTLPGELSALGPTEVDVIAYDLVALAMQEPQYRAPEIRELLRVIAKARVPCMSIMNMPPLVYLKRIPSINTETIGPAYTDPTVWEEFSPSSVTLCSPDPQAFRPAGEPINTLQVTLPTNFKAARFDSNEHTQMLRNMQRDIEALQIDENGIKIDLPVKLKVHDSVFVPLAKWAMLITGNYRCVTKNGARSIKEAVHTDIEKSNEIYNWVRELCIHLGARIEDLVPFEKYAAAAQGLASPSSAARALFSGAKEIERVDRLVQIIARQNNMQNSMLDEIVDLVDARLAENRKTT